MNSRQYNKELFTFIQASPSPFHAAAFVEKELKKNRFIPLKEKEPWDLEPGKKYVITRNDSCVIAIVLGEKDPVDTGFRIIGAHTDSPCLKVKPNPELISDGLTRLGVEVYGGALLGTWFDRGLNLAGRITGSRTGKNGQETLFSCLINYQRPMAVIPSLAIHFDREAGPGKAVNSQLHCLPFFKGQGSTSTLPFKETLLEQVKIEHPESSIRKVLDYELCLCDEQPPFYSGLDQEFICSPRLDNLLSCHAGFKSILDADTSTTSILILADHEEVGSDSAAGARGSFLTTVIARLLKTSERRAMTAARSFMISCDNAHAVHPSFKEKYDSNHLPGLNQGPVLKINASQRYASNSESAAFFRTLCARAHLPCQTFVMRSDIPCGSTIGPAISSSTGIKTVDIGAPTLAMHSIREITGSEDPLGLYKVLKQFLTLPDQPLLSLT